MCSHLFVSVRLAVSLKLNGHDLYVNCGKKYPDSLQSLRVFDRLHESDEWLHLNCASQILQDKHVGQRVYINIYVSTQIWYVESMFTLILLYEKLLRTCSTDEKMNIVKQMLLESHHAS